MSNKRPENNQPKLETEQVVIIDPDVPVGTDDDDSGEDQAQVSDANPANASDTDDEQDQAQIPLLPPVSYANPTNIADDEIFDPDVDPAFSNKRLNIAHALHLARQAKYAVLNAELTASLQINGLIEAPKAVRLAKGQLDKLHALASKCRLSQSVADFTKFRDCLIRAIRIDVADGIVEDCLAIFSHDLDESPIRINREVRPLVAKKQNLVAAFNDAITQLQISKYNCSPLLAYNLSCTEPVIFSAAELAELAELARALPTERVKAKLDSEDLAAFRAKLAEITKITFQAKRHDALLLNIVNIVAKNEYYVFKMKLKALLPLQQLPHSPTVDELKVLKASAMAYSVTNSKEDFEQFRIDLAATLQVNKKVFTDEIVTDALAIFMSNRNAEITADINAVIEPLREPTLAVTYTQPRYEYRPIRTKKDILELEELARTINAYPKTKVEEYKRKLDQFYAKLKQLTRMRLTPDPLVRKEILENICKVFVDSKLRETLDQGKAEVFVKHYDSLIREAAECPAGRQLLHEEAQANLLRKMSYAATAVWGLTHRAFSTSELNHSEMSALEKRIRIATNDEIERTYAKLINPEFSQKDIKNDIGDFVLSVAELIEGQTKVPAGKIGTEILHLEQYYVTELNVNRCLLTRTEPTYARDSRHATVNNYQAEIPLNATLTDKQKLEFMKIHDRRNAFADELPAVRHWLRTVVPKKLEDSEGWNRFATLRFTSNVQGFGIIKNARCKHYMTENQFGQMQVESSGVKISTLVPIKQHAKGWRKYVPLRLAKYLAPSKLAKNQVRRELTEQSVSQLLAFFAEDRGATFRERCGLGDKPLAYQIFSDALLRDFTDEEAGLLKALVGPSFTKIQELELKDEHYKGISFSSKDITEIKKALAKIGTEQAKQLSNKFTSTKKAIKPTILIHSLLSRVSGFGLINPDNDMVDVQEEALDKLKTKYGKYYHLVHGDDPANGYRNLRINNNEGWEHTHEVIENATEFLIALAVPKRVTQSDYDAVESIVKNSIAWENSTSRSHDAALDILLDKIKTANATRNLTTTPKYDVRLIVACIRYLRELQSIEDLPDRNKRIIKAAVTAMLVKAMGGEVSENCKSGKDRTGEAANCEESMQQFYAETGTLPKYNELDAVDREFYRKKYRAVFRHKLTQESAGLNAPGAFGIKDDFQRSHMLRSGSAAKFFKITHRVVALLTMLTGGMAIVSLFVPPLAIATVPLFGAAAGLAAVWAVAFAAYHLASRLQHALRPIIDLDIAKSMPAERHSGYLISKGNKLKYKKKHKNTDNTHTVKLSRTPQTCFLDETVNQIARKWLDTRPGYQLRHSALKDEWDNLIDFLAKNPKGASYNDLKPLLLAIYDKCEVHGIKIMTAEEFARINMERSRRNENVSSGQQLRVVPPKLRKTVSPQQVSSGFFEQTRKKQPKPYPTGVGNQPYLRTGKVRN